MSTLLSTSVRAAVLGLLLTTTAAAGGLLICLDADNPPYMSGKGREATGVYPAIMLAAFAKLGIEVEFAPIPWKRALREIDEAKCGLGGLYMTEERLTKYDYSAAIHSESLAVYFNKGKPLQFRTLNDLQGKTIGVIRGWSYGDDFDAARQAGRFAVVENQSDLANLQKLAAGRLDAVIAADVAAITVIKANNLTDIEQSKDLLTVNKTYLAFNKQAAQTELLANFNKVIAGMKKDGSLDRIILHELSR